VLVKSHRRNPDALDHGTYMIVDGVANFVVFSGLESGYGLSLDDVEAFLETR
jgi:hypothetical protein